MAQDYHFTPMAAAGAAPLASPAFTGIVGLPAGAVATPGTVVTGDVDTGLCQTAADSLTLVAGGQSMLTVAATEAGLGGALGTEALKARYQAGAVNRVEVTGAVTGANPLIAGRGSDTNVGVTYDAKGAGTHRFTAGGTEVFRVATASTLGAYLEVSAFNTPRVAARGSATDVSLYVATQGAGTHLFDTAGGTQFRTGHVASAVNCLQAFGSVATTAPSLRATGSDTDIDLQLTPKNQGRVRFGTHQATGDVAVTGYIEIRDAGGTLRRLAVVG
ncbi:hypothetical protein [Niveispirillum sp. KHB5.9]|uniref:hypothetical protein n=1 Tax=Niveispirillum sp. KHB5.9 TaxID=3400269 RepID=UPI003A8651BB